jgi:putative SOS response-associated peptidase YedK
MERVLEDDERQINTLFLILLTSIAKIHDRMPAILERTQIKTWLNRNLSAVERVNFLRNNRCPSEFLKITVHKDHQLD